MTPNQPGENDTVTRALSSFLKAHQDLPPGVHSYPTLKGKKRFEVLQAFNTVLAVYILIHQLLVPLVVYFLQTGTEPRKLLLGFWYFYHLVLAFWLSKRWRSARSAFWIVYLSWFAVGYLPITFASTFFVDGVFRFQWKALSGLLCYGSSLVLTAFLLYRMRMPTTAFLFGLENRIIPKWRYAVPYALLGLVVSLFWLICPIGREISGKPEVLKPANPAVDKRFLYD
jgi:hypothetical protein